MKKHYAKVLLAAFAVMLLSMSVLVGCGGGGAPESLDGTKWELSSAEYNGVKMDVAQFAQMTGVSADQLTIEFKDGKAIASGQEASAVEYTYENGKVTLQGITMSVNGDTMEGEQDGAKIVLKKK